jgi:DNA-binding XRE family transcriptional regulator
MAGRPVGSVKSVKTTFAVNLDKLLAERGITCYKLAKEIDYSESCLSRIRKSKAEPSIGMLIAVAKYFGVTTDSLLA